MARSIDAQPGVRGFVPAQNDEERFLMRHVEDLARAAFGRGIARYSAFLSDREQQLAQAALNRADAPEESCRFEGGWPGAERRVLCLEPEDCYPACPVCCVRLRCRGLAGAQLPVHKDYLGSLMGLELRREALGDIVLPPEEPGTAYVFALEPAADLICQELRSVGRTEVTAQLLALDEVPQFAEADGHRVVPASGRCAGGHAAVQPGHGRRACGGGTGGDQPSARFQRPRAGVPIGCVHRAGQGALPPDGSAGQE